jgi:hypothetical protein
VPKPITKNTEVIPSPDNDTRQRRMRSCKGNGVAVRVSLDHWTALPRRRRLAFVGRPRWNESAAGTAEVVSTGKRNQNCKRAAAAAAKGAKADATVSAPPRLTKTSTGAADGVSTGGRAQRKKCPAVAAAKGAKARVTASTPQPSNQTQRSPRRNAADASPPAEADSGPAQGEAPFSFCKQRPRARRAGAPRAARCRTARSSTRQVATRARRMSAGSCRPLPTDLSATQRGSRRAARSLWRAHLPVAWLALSRARLQGPVSRAAIISSSGTTSQ